MVFNSALLGECWWKLSSDVNWCGWPIVRYNYGISNWNLHIHQHGWASFYWGGFFCCLSALKGCTEQIVQDGSRSLFWKDKWLNGRAPMNIWPDSFTETDNPNGTVRELIHRLEFASFREDLEVGHFFGGLYPSCWLARGRFEMVDPNP